MPAYDLPSRSGGSGPTVVPRTPVGLPQPQGLYHPSREHDACGVGFVAHIKGRKSHAIIQQGLKILENLDHRGSLCDDELFGEGAVIMLTISDALTRDDMTHTVVTLSPTTVST